MRLILLLAIDTGYFYVNAFDELQIGVGAGAVVYRTDDVAGTLTADAGLAPFVPPAFPDELCR